MSTLSGRDKQSKGTVCINVNKKNKHQLYGTSPGVRSWLAALITLIEKKVGEN